MTTRDPYDPSVAFDDLYGSEPDAPEQGLPSDGELRFAASSILRRSVKGSLRPPSMDVVGSVYDATEHTFEVPNVMMQVLGGAEGLHAPPSPSGLPLFDSLRERFKRALPSAKMVRVDDAESYSLFRNARKKPYIERLEQRLSALESAVAQHTADNHGGGKLAALTDEYHDHLSEHDAEIVGILDEARVGGKRVDLPVPAWAKGRVECWQDGTEILCSVRLDARKPRVATTGMKLNAVAEEVVGHAAQVGVSPESLMIVGPPLIRVLGGGKLLPQLFKSKEVLVKSSVEGPFVGVLSSTADPNVAAAMALVQRGQHGERAALNEIGALAHTNANFLQDAINRLLRGQKTKAESRRL